MTNYSYGGPKDGELTGKITGSGARSITIEDINKKAGIYEDKTDGKGKMKDRDGNVIESNYGNEDNPTSNDVCYPTVNGYSATGEVYSRGAKNLKYTSYSYNKSKIENATVQNMLFNGKYWLASRCIASSSGYASYQVRYAWLGVNARQLCASDGPSWYNGALNEDAVRPVVILKSDVIDISANYDSENGWKLK